MCHPSRASSAVVDVHPFERFLRCLREYISVKMPLALAAAAAAARIWFREFWDISECGSKQQQIIDIVVIEGGDCILPKSYVFG